MVLTPVELIKCGGDLKLNAFDSETKQLSFLTGGDMDLEMK
jgi:hypothetical protein